MRTSGTSAVPSVDESYLTRPVTLRLYYDFPNLQIAALRRQAGFSQTELAERIGITQRLMSEIERGNRALMVPLAFVLSSFFGVSLNALLGIPEQKVLIRKFCNAPDDLVEKLHNVEFDDSVEKEYMSLNINGRRSFRFAGRTRIRQIRRFYNWMPRNFAAKFETKTKQFNNWEAAGPPPLAACLVISSMMGVTVNFMLGIPEDDVLAEHFSMRYQADAMDVSQNVPFSQLRKLAATKTLAQENYAAKDTEQYAFLGRWQRVLPIWVLQRASYLRSSMLKAEKQGSVLTPGSELVFRPFQETPPKQVRVVFVRRQPYANPMLNDGFCFSACHLGLQKVPAALRHLLELWSGDTGLPMPLFGDLTPWANQGVLMLNFTMTTLSYFTDTCSYDPQTQWTDIARMAVAVCSASEHPVVFVTFGKLVTQAVRPFIDLNLPQNRLIEMPLINPYHADGYFSNEEGGPAGDVHLFTHINDLLTELGESPVDWRLS